jgi:alpha-ketoglutarate-dependent taurine dioxygenase
MTRTGKRPSFSSVETRPTRIAEGVLVRKSLLPGPMPFPMVVEPAMEGVDVVSWLSHYREDLQQMLVETGAVLFRAFDITTIAGFERAATAIAPELLEYKERSTPRTLVTGRIYTSTEYPPQQRIAFHNEFSYSLTWPMKIAFCCITAPEEGGETPLADSQAVFESLPHEVRDEFAARKVRYVRNYGSGIDLPWEEAFQTTGREQVEEHCRKAEVCFEWRGGDRLRTWQVREAVARHPATGAMVWFNQAHLFHIASHSPEVRRSLVETFGTDDLPRNAYFGDGGEIPAAMVQSIHEAYERNAVAFPWRAGDLLVADNMRMAHGRMPYRGARSILVAMGEPCTHA